MKPAIQPMLGRFGYRNVLVWNGALGAITLALCAAFQSHWSILLMDAVLFTGGLFRSVQFTAYNTIAYDEIPPERMSQATSFYATFQQLMLSLGICVGAAALHIGMLTGGRVSPVLSDFSLAFLVVTAVSAAATLWNRRFDHAAGTELSGHVVQLAPQKA